MGGGTQGVSEGSIATGLGEFAGPCLKSVCVKRTELDHAHEVVKFGPFDANTFEAWASKFSKPGGNTPLGNALSAATHAVLDSPLSRKHVLILTDGLNTAGPPPNLVLPKLKKLATDQHSSFSVHFVAFDV